jgi:hypothetical protein
MADKSSILRSFNQLFFDFVNDIIFIFPDNIDINTAKTSFELIKKSNPTAIIKVWYAYVAIPYNDVIQQGNIDYFIEKDYAQDLTQLSNSNDIIKIIDSLRNPIKNMGESNKQTSCVYIQKLTTLSVMYSKFMS